MQLIVDDRERAIFKYLDKYSEKSHIEYKIQRNTVGDYALVYKSVVVLIIERKTWTDLGSSFRDGRKENVEKLKSLRELTGCTVAYLIEGNPTPEIDQLYSRIPVRNLRAHLDHLALRDNIVILYSYNIEYTAGRLFELALNYLSMKDVIGKIEENLANLLDFDQNQKAIVGGVDLSANTNGPLSAKSNTADQREIAENNNDTDKLKIKVKATSVELQTTSKTANQREIAENTNVQLQENTNVQLQENTNVHLLQAKILVESKAKNEQLLRCIPKVGSIVSSILADEEITIANLYIGKYSPSDIAILKYPTGKTLGLVKGTQITEGFKSIVNSTSIVNTKIKCKILSCIPLITVKTAASLLQAYPLSDILNSKVTVDDLANIKMPSGKNLLGKKASSNVLNYLF